MRINSVCFGILFPLLALLFEASSGTCSANFVDPIPTVWHSLLILSVPAFHIHWLRSPPWGPLMCCWAGFALVVCAVYTVLFLPSVPLALMLSPFLPCTLALAPALAFQATCRVVFLHGFDNPTRVGAELAVLALLAANLPIVWTRHWASQEDTFWLRHLGCRKLLLGACVHNYVAAPDISRLWDREEIPYMQAGRLFCEVYGSSPREQSTQPLAMAAHFLQGDTEHGVFHPDDARMTPEPSGLALLVVGACLGLRRRRP